MKPDTNVDFSLPYPLARQRMKENLAILDGLAGTGHALLPMCEASTWLKETDLAGFAAWSLALENIKRCSNDPLFHRYLEIYQVRIQEHGGDDAPPIRRYIDSSHRLDDILKKITGAMNSWIRIEQCSSLHRSYLKGWTLRVGLRSTPSGSFGMMNDLALLAEDEAKAHPEHVAFLQKMQNRSWTPRFLFAFSEGWVLIEEKKTSEPMPISSFRQSIFDGEDDVIYSQIVPVTDLQLSLLALLCLPPPLTPFSVRASLAQRMAIEMKTAQRNQPGFRLGRSYLRMPWRPEAPRTKKEGWFGIADGRFPLSLESILHGNRGTGLHHLRGEMPSTLTGEGEGACVSATEQGKSYSFWRGSPAASLLPRRYQAPLPKVIKLPTPS